MKVMSARRPHEPAAQSPRKIVLIHKRAPGDTLVLTGLVRDLMLTYPGQFQIDVDTSGSVLWNNNPYLTSLRKPSDKVKRDIEYIKITYGKGIRDQNYEPVHFLHYFHRDFALQCKVPLAPLLPYPDLHLSEAERTHAPVPGRYWVVFSGGKSDFTAKVWSVRRMQTVVAGLRDMGLTVVQSGSLDHGHWHPPLEGVVNMIGKTNMRELIQLIHHADGVICPVTCAMHMAAALQRPCVVLAGGREAWWWEAYVRENKGLGESRSKLVMPHRFLHTIGLLDCCKQHGCWKNKVVKINGDPSVCARPVMDGNQPVPTCLDLISVNHVMEAVMSYYSDNSLPPVDAPLPAAPAPTPPLVLPVTVVGPPQVLPKPAAKPNKACGRGRMALPAGLLAKLANGERVTGRKLLIPGARRQQTTKLPPPPAAELSQIDPGVLDHPDVGGKFTVFALLYGPEQFYDLHMRCLNAIMGTVAPERLDLRIGSNELNARSLAFVERLAGQGIVTKHYRHEHNDYKYPVMREMFWDPMHPITTKWVIWFDDDSIADRTPEWLKVLGMAIAQCHSSQNVHMFGAKFIWSMQQGQREWITTRPWYKGRQFRLNNGEPATSGSKIIFATGGWWAVTHEAMVTCDIPDVTIQHNGGDWLIGEQLYQGGFALKNFNARKQFINTSSVPRRGVTTQVPGRLGKGGR